MQRPTPARRRLASAPLAVLLAGSILLAGCGGGSEEGSDAKKATTTTTAPKGSGGKATTTTTEAGGANAKVLDDFAKALEGSGFDADQQECILEVADEGLGAGWDAKKLDAAYTDQCGVSATQVTAGAYYAALVDRGVDEAAAACARDLYGNLTVEQAAVFQEDTEARDSLLKGCKIDPAVIAAG